MTDRETAISWIKLILKGELYQEQVLKEDFPREWMSLIPEGAWTIAEFNEGMKMGFIFGLRALFNITDEELNENV